ncbi:S9 family peptidase [Kordiimonas sp. SCSIO 12603]|uniref:prolyl oligopeptidase family serine peptidase n=1 Tax=Kordiimonas sp. SCSIO 12603 TaxID=2829596 RepID=UPI00210297E3|nr:prolyl oligopeptidase family serine peptidase [Kordiimonas sp. SCSIO 12603]UTW59754.1 S9 family peptidase [Kordiimonas sp. SCSIO 12603]
MRLTAQALLVVAAVWITTATKSQNASDQANLAMSHPTSTLAQETTYKEIAKNLSHRLQQYDYWGNGYRDGYFLNITISNGSIGLGTSSFDEQVYGDKKWTQYPSVKYDQEPRLKNKIITDIECLSDNMDLCLITFNEGGTDKTTIYEANLKTGALNPRGFILSTGYNSANYLNKHGDILYSHSPKLLKYAKTYKIWQQNDEGSVSSILTEPPLDADGSFTRVLSKKHGALVNYSKNGAVIETIFVNPSGKIFSDKNQKQLTLKNIYPSCNPLFALSGRVFCSASYYGKDQQGNDVPITAVTTVPTSSLLPVSHEKPEITQIFQDNDTEFFEEAVPTETGLFIKTYAPQEAREKLYFIHNENQKNIQEIPLPVSGKINIWGTSITSKDAVIYVENTTQPITYYRISPNKDAAHTKITALPSSLNSLTATEFKTHQNSVTTFDGIEIYYEIIGTEKAFETGSAPTLITAYAYDHIPLKPEYHAPVIEGWLKRGGLYVIAHPRGGGEYKRDFAYSSTKIEQRLKTVDDFILIAKDVLAKGYTRPGSLHATGASAGASLVVNAALLNPDIFTSVSARAGCYDITVQAIDACNAYLAPLKDAQLSDPDTKGKQLSNLLIPSKQIPIYGKTLDKLTFLIIANKNDDRVSFAHSKSLEKTLVNEGYSIETLYRPDGGHTVGSTIDQYVEIHTSMYLFHTFHDRQYNKTKE